MKKRKLFNAAGLILLTACACYILLHGDLLFKKSFSVVYTDIVCAALDSEGNQVIVDSGGQRLLKVSPENEVVFEKKYRMNSAKGLNKVAKLAVDQDDNIFLLNNIKEEGGFRYRREEIVKYSSSGEYQGVIFAVDHETPTLAKDITGLSLYHGQMVYFLGSEDATSLYGEDGRLVHTYEGKGMKELVITYALDPSNDELYYSTKQGKIYRYHEGGEPFLLYDAANYDYLSIPRDISLDGQGGLYFTDIGLRTVSKLEEDGSLSHVIYDGEVGVDTSYKYIYTYLSTENGLITQTSDFTVMLRDGEQVNSQSAGYSAMVCFLIVLGWVAVVLAAVLALCILLELFFFLIKKGSGTLKLSMGVMSGAMVIAGIFIFMVIPDFEDRLLDSVLKQAQAISDVIQIVLPKEEYKNLNSTADFLGEDYNAVRGRIKEVFSDRNDDINDFYCVLYKIQDGDIITGTYSLEEYSGAVYPYDWGYEGSDEEWIITHKEGRVYTDNTTSEGSYLFVLNPLFDKDDNVIGLVEVGTDLHAFHTETNRMIIELLLNVFAITVIIILVALEFIIFQHGRQTYLKEAGEKAGNALAQVPNEVLRILVFGIFFITNVTTSFLPIYAMNISETGFALGLPKEVLAAIPISAEVLFGAIGSIFGSRLVDRLGQKRSAMIGSLLFTAGLLVRFMLPDIWILTLGNSIMGYGWGILLLLVNTAIASGNGEEKNKGFAGYTAAALNGVNCGVVFGGFLTNWLGHRMIFLVAAVLSTAIVAHAFSYLTKIQVHREEETRGEGRINLLQFLTDRRVLRFFLMIAIPVIACSYFLNYLYPILGSEYGLSENRIGYSYLINGLCVMFFGTVLTRFFSRKVRKEYSLVVAALLYGTAFLCVAVFQNVYSLLLALVLLGLSDSFGLPLQTSYYTDLEVVRKYGYGKSIGIYSLFENLSQAGGSFVFSYVLIIGVQRGLGIVLVVVVGLALLFGILEMFRNRMDRKKEYHIC
ncbi:MAG TPA: MFS transporter [Clostridiales bacterium]|nr:MFS transporter [Clostridiales bacterium]